MTVLETTNVPLGAGPPTREELIAHYPAKFTWEELKTFINSGDLGLLKRDKALQKRYVAWTAEIRKEYGSMVNYLTKHRLQWGKPDTLSVLPTAVREKGAEEQPRTLSEPPTHFTHDIPREYLSIIQADWPYSVPIEVEHSLIWTKVPVYHPSTLDPKTSPIAPRIFQDGIWGFTGLTSPPPSPSKLPLYLPSLAEWGTTMESLVISPRGTDEEEQMVRKAGAEVNKFIMNRWDEDEWETAWFVNPPRLQSIPALAHIHVFARKKTT